ncbi:hypothetical protein [Sphingomonas sp. PB4P5]|uniref:hypothetical protein n=1 Tax=Parasphingomonas puruogangriensis TaxID=3096155 RepID=UPI002FCB4F8B
MPHQFIISLGAIILVGCGSQAGSTNAAEPAPTPIPTALSMASARADQAASTIDRTNASGTSAIAPVLIAHGTLDGDSITDFKLRSRCETDLVTAKGTTTIDWSKVGNLAEHDEGNQVVTPIDDGSGPHQLAMPKAKQTPTVGDVASVVNMGLSGIVDICAK